MTPHFKTIALVGRFDDQRVTDAMVAIAAHAAARGATVLADEAGAVAYATAVERVPEETFADRADLMVAIGGDGTMLHAARLAVGRNVPLLGINRGRLGFLADISSDQTLDRLEDVLAGRYTRDERRLLAAELRSPGGEVRRAVALNDVVMQKWDTGRMLDFETYVDGQYVNTHGGDGLVAATSTGSTAYALSCGGPIVHPTLDALVLAPISPHTLSDRPIVVSRESRVEVRLVSRSSNRAQVMCDAVLLGDLEQDGRLSIGPAAAYVTLLHPPGYDYYRILRSKLHWGRGARHGTTDG
jgi:NAD+ kinase